MREPTILGRLSSLTNFDYLGMKNPSSKLFPKLNAVLQKNNEDQNTKVIFTEQIFQIDSKMRKNKRIMVVTQHSFYCLRENFTIKMKVELKNITKVFLIKANSSLVAFSKSKESSNEVDILIETVKRTELFFFMLD